MSEKAFYNDSKRQVALSKISPEVRSQAIGLIITNQAILVGYKGEIDSLIQLDIARLLTTRFRTFSLEEINYAFQLDRFGYHGDPTSHYQLFNTEYVVSIMNRYIKWKENIRFSPDSYESGKIRRV